MPRVLWRDAQGKEGLVELTAQEIHIGRAVDCAIRTDDAMVSRHHARLYWGGNQYFVEDLGSANGVFFQEQRVTRHPLKHGDAVRCGSLWLRFVDSPPAYGQAPVPQPVAAPPSAPQPTPQAVPQAMAQAVRTPSSMHVGPATGAPPAVQSPPMVYRPPSQQMPVPQQVQTPAPVQPAPSSSSSEDAEEIKRLQRRIEQLQTELRFYRGGKGSEVAKRMEELENDNAKLEREVSQLKARVKDAEASVAAASGDVKLLQAAALAAKTSEAVQTLNDVLSDLRIHVMAAEGEFEQFAHQIPRASFELIRESLRSSAKDVDQARELLRALRELASS